MRFKDFYADMIWAVTWLALGMLLGATFLWMALINNVVSLELLDMGVFELLF